MRVLHTADWHLGRVLYNHARQDDEMAVLGEIVAIARDHKPDLIIHAGDLFDAVRPPYEAMTLGLDTLRELAGVAPTVVVCGNHDSPVLFRIFQKLLGDEARLRFIDRARRPAEGGILDYPVGKQRLRLAPLPFVHQNRLVEAFEDPGQRTVAYADRIGEIEGVLRQGLLDGFDASRDVLLFAAHLHVTGARFSGSERELHVSDVYATRVEHLPTVSYAAFGHIHRPQSLPGPVPGRYSGSPIQLDFGELEDSKHVVLIDVEPGEPARVEQIALAKGRRLARFTGTYQDLERWAKELKDELCLVTVDVPEPVADLSRRLVEMAPKATFLQVQERVANRRLAPVEELGDPGREPTLEEHFRTYLETQGTKGATADRVLALFRTVHQALENGEEPKFTEEALLLDEVVVPPPTGAEEPPAPEKPGEQTSLFGLREAEAGKDDPASEEAPMRPRRLEIQGLRSYRQRQEIDFTGANLVAILGDTGAGKSSILEALCVALYAGSTWDKRSVKALISAGMPTLDVVLEFTADGKEWKVHRSFPAGNYPPSTHSLIGVTDGSQLNGAREVTDRIVELVGLDYEAFLRAVLLPQGRFQALLQAPGGERTSILKGIFRLDVLERVREVARTRFMELAVRLADLQVQRAKLLDDPATAAALAQREHAEAAREQQRLKIATAAVRAANQTETELQRVAGLLDRSARTARDQDPAAPLGEIGPLVALAKEVEAKRAVQLALKAELDAEHGALAGSLKKAEAAGLGYDALLGAGRTLVELLEWIEKDAAARAQLGADEKQNGEKSKRLAALRTEVEALARRLAEAKAEVEKNRVARDAARRGFDDAKRLLEGARATLRQRDKQRSSLTERESNLASCRQEVADATSKAKASASVLKAAEKAAAEARRGHAAAHAAAGIESGDPCPVCDRKLPAGWKAPGAKDLKKAESALAAAAAAEQASQAQVTKLSARAEDLEGRLNEDRAALDSAEKELRVAVAALREIAGKGADPAATGDAPLEPLERKAAAAVKLLGEVERACGDREKSLREREGELARMDAEVKASQTQVAAARGRLELDRKSADRKLAALPEPLRATSLETKLLEAARKRTTKEVEAAKASREREKDLGTSLRNVQAAVSALDEQRTREVTKPTSVVARRLDDLRRALEDLASEVEGDAPPKSDADAPSEVAAWARELGASREKLLRGVDARAKQIDSELAATRKKATAALSEAGVESEAVLDAQSTAVAVTLQRKTEDLDLARGQIDLAAELDRRIAGGTPLVDALKALSSVLTDGRFIRHVVDRKQQSLLVVASKLLGDMTKNRYGFSQEFDVVDRLTGEPRSVMTLSGGETFLASLALALGLVELAGREGGRLDALLLDEGFGSLDANALADALEALDRQAKERMVAVISHLHAVAESIERVLWVELTPAGSRARWLSESERATLLEQEATAGLLI